MANMYVFSVVVTHGYGGVREFRRERLILVEGGKLTSDPYNVFQLWSKVSCGVLPSFHYFSLFLTQFAMASPVSPDPIR